MFDIEKAKDFIAKNIEVVINQPSIHDLYFFQPVTSENEIKLIIELKNIIFDRWGKTVNEKVLDNLFYNIFEQYERERKDKKE